MESLPETPGSEEGLPLARAVDAGIAGVSPLHFDIFTLFPQMFVSPFAESIIRRALDNRLISIALHNIRDYTIDRHHICDDTPYGGGGGMIMKPEPIIRAVETVLAQTPGWALPPADAYINLPPWDAQQKASLPPNVPVILLTPQGRPLTQSIVTELSQYARLALLCGRYEGVDERVRTQVITDEISIGDYVISGGELAAMILVDAITRLRPGALGYALAAHQDSHSAGLDGLLEGPQYTRPHTFRNETVPDILLSGHHANQAKWRREQALLRTLQQRPELLETLPLTPKDYAFLRQQGWHATKPDAT
ncbi:MAG: tRNA (guanosine(37)-N1)-methyltransferase TrmD [Caldilineaceae bacterium]|nr:tRNA (guanosine(37)-N1)-methyltransferase TrmD [Caldilineaceae bacterium]